MAALLLMRVHVEDELAAGVVGIGVVQERAVDDDDDNGGVDTGTAPVQSYACGSRRSSSNSQWPCQALCALLRCVQGQQPGAMMRSFGRGQQLPQRGRRCLQRAGRK